MNREEQEDSNSVSVNVVPLAKRQASSKNVTLHSSDNQQKIRLLSYQIIEEVSIITPLSLHPKQFSEGIENYYYQRKLPSMIDTAEYAKKQQKQKVDFVMAITSLFRKAVSENRDNGQKFTIYLQNGGLVYFFRQEKNAAPLVYICTQHYEFNAALSSEGIAFKELDKREGERERIIVEKQYIKLFFGYFINWALKKKSGVDIYANYDFVLALRQAPLFFELIQHRPEFEHLSQKEESCIGQEIRRLKLIRLQSVYYRQDIQKIEERIRHYQMEQDRKTKGNKLAHEYEFKISKFAIDLTQGSLDDANIYSQ